MQQDIGDDGRDYAGDVAGDGRWLSYEELAAIRQISRRAAVRMTQRHHLRRQPGNDGKMRVWVSGDMLVPTLRTSQRDDRGDVAGDRAGVMSVHTRALAALQEAVTGLTQRAEQAEARADEANRRADAALAVADRTLAQLGEAAARMEEAERDRREALALIEKTVAMLTDERARAEEARQQDAALIANLRAKDTQADGLRDRLVGAQAELSLAQAAADRARTEAQAVQERADAAIGAERQQASAVQERLDHTEHDLAVAQHDAQAAQEAAAELRLAEETRQARGRLRRAWDGWRGR
jgi:hypothetical protein